MFPNTREELNAAIFKVEAQELNINPDNVPGTGLAREFVPSYMQGDICDRPERNVRPKPFDDNDDGLSETGIIMNPNQGGPSNTKGDLNSPIDSNFESSNYSTEIESKTNNNGSIFGRFFGFFGVGTAEGNICPGTDILYNSLSNTAQECSGNEESNRTFLEMLFGFLIPDCGSGMSYDPTSASSTLPMYLDLGCDPNQAKE